MKRLLPILLLVFSVGVGAETIEWERGTYTGALVNGVPHGQGKVITLFSMYVGGFKDGKKHGQGSIKYFNFWTQRMEKRGYVGEWKNGREHGQGTYTWANGSKYVGEFEDGRKLNGTKYLPSGDVDGVFTKGQFSRGGVGVESGKGWCCVSSKVFYSSGETRPCTRRIGKLDFKGNIFPSRPDAERACKVFQYREVIKDYRPLAEDGVAWAQAKIGEAYKILNEDIESNRWHRSAAMQGVVSSQRHMGVVNQRLGDSELAVEWYRKALMQGDADSACEIGFLYWTGDGIPRDQVKAHAYFSVGEALGGAIACLVASSVFKETEKKNLSRQGNVLAGRIWAEIHSAKKGSGGGSHAGTKKSSGTGTGFIINKQGYVVTNSHVVKNCSGIKTIQNGTKIDTTIVTNDSRNDLAVLKMSKRSSKFATFRSGRGIRAGEDILAFGFPLKSVLSDELKGTKGMINALSGLNNDTRFIQMSAPTQPGNSGGPLLDQAGNVVGVVTAKLNAVKMAKHTGDMPQNVNFALKASLVRDMLEVKDIDYETASSKKKIETVDIFDKAKKFTVLVDCLQ